MIWNVPYVWKLKHVFVLENVHTLYALQFAFQDYISVQCVPKLKEAGISVVNE